MRKSFIKIIAIALIVGLNWTGLSAVIETIAYFNDTETSLSNSYTAATLDFSLNQQANFSPNIIPTNLSTETIGVVNDGNLNFQYKIKVDNLIGDLCNYLELKASLGGIDVGYTGTLQDFTYSKDEMTAPEDWIFTTNLTSSDPLLQNQTCTFDFIFSGLQTGGIGFSDQEKISNTVTSGSWVIESGSWIQTTPEDFNAGIGTNVDTSSNPGNIVLLSSGGGNNLAYNAAATADSSDSTHTPGKAFDGDISSNDSYWKGTGNGDAWLKVDLGNSYNINKIVLYFKDNPTHIANTFTLETSQTGAFGGEQSIVANVTGNNNAGPLTYTFSTVNARYVRLYIPDDNGQPGVLEMMVYSAPAYNNSPGIFESQIFDAGAIKRWQQLSWIETLPTGTDITLEVATSNDGTTWSNWILGSSSSSIDLTSLPETTHIKWRTTLTTTDITQTPILQEVVVTYLAGTASENIVLNEFLPNPSGFEYGFDFGEDNDLMPKGEWVEIYNKASGSTVDLAGWYIKDIEGNIKYITPANTNTGITTINSGDWIVVYMNGETLNNNNDTVSLYDNLNNLIDSYSYNLSTYCTLEPTPDTANNETGLGSCPSEIPGNKSYARIPDGIGAWQDPIPTPGTLNKITEEEPITIGSLLLEGIISTTTTTTTIPEIDVPLEELVTTTIESLIEETNSTTTTTIPVEVTTTTTTEPVTEETMVIVEEPVAPVLDVPPVDEISPIIESQPIIEAKLVSEISVNDIVEGSEIIPSE
ncbi:MAG: lamin tail domain-containing protein [Minisyncoccia bacterium]